MKEKNTVKAMLIEWSAKAVALGVAGGLLGLAARSEWYGSDGLFVDYEFLIGVGALAGFITGLTWGILSSQIKFHS